MPWLSSHVREGHHLQVPVRLAPLHELDVVQRLALDQLAHLDVLLAQAHTRFSGRVSFK
jgi:hypothetical protein